MDTEKAPSLEADEPSQTPPEKDSSQSTRTPVAPLYATSSTTNPDSLPKNDPAYLVKFEANDPADPKNFNPYYKAFLVLQLSMLTFSGSLGSSIISPAGAQIAAYVGVSLEATVLTVSLYVLGFAFGPPIWAPLAELKGRKWSMLPAVFVLGIFSIGVATSTNAASIFVTRYFCGVSGSAPISNAMAALGDFYVPKTRGIPVSLVAMVVVGGAALGPVVGAAIVVNAELGWRWTQYIQAIVAFSSCALAFFGMPETYAPVLLSRKAQKMRENTGDKRYWHPHEQQKINFSNIFTKYLSRPVRMFLTEPMVLCISLYASFIYSLLYLTLEVFPIVFHQNRHYSLFISTLPFLGLFTGVLCAIAINLANQPLYAAAVKKNDGKAAPKARLPPIAVGGLLFTTGLFWFGWTAAPKYSWALPVVAAGFIGAGFNIAFQQCLNYLVDTYGPYAASAVSANTILRSLLSCGIPLAGRPMFEHMGVPAAASLLGGISCLALPLPWLFMRFGKTLREKSRFVEVEGR